MSTHNTQHQQGVIITIDGPAGTGKSTVAHLLAVRLGLDILDTGAMYRAVALIAIEHDIDAHDGAALAAAVQAADLHFDFRIDPPPMMLGDRDVSRRIRDSDVSDIVSIVAAHRVLRSELVEQQRRVAERHPRLVTEGRDQGRPALRKLLRKRSRSAGFLYSSMPLNFSMDMSASNSMAAATSARASSSRSSSA